MYMGFDKENHHFPTGEIGMGGSIHWLGLDPCMCPRVAMCVAGSHSLTL